MSEHPSPDMLWGASDMSDLDELMVEETTNKLNIEYTDLNNNNIKFDQDAFLWENIKLEDAEQLLKNFEAFEIPDVVEMTEDRQPIDSVPSPSTSSECCDETDVRTGSKTKALMKLYELDDDKLGDITLKKLKSICHSTSDYDFLKAYRRTCLNRHYARSSRTKQQNKTSGLATKLKESQQEVARLRQENDMKDATIRCLQLELDFMRSLKN